MSRQRSHSHPIRNAAALPLDPTLVADCLNTDQRPTDALFKQAFESSLAAVERGARRGVLSGITGHVAESVVEVALAEFGWAPVWHFVGPGRHGVDLLMLDPSAERLFAIEVKGTLRPDYWPRLRSGELMQMEATWLDKRNNPAMVDWDLTSEDLYGGLALVNFAGRRFKLAFTSDFACWHPVELPEQLENLDWVE